VSWRRVRVVGVLVVAASAVTAVVLNVVVLAGGRSRSGTSAPVALVLGAGLRPDGSPSLMLADRLAVAADLYRTGRVGTVLASGDHGTHAYDEVTAMRQRLVELGVPDERVFTDHAGFDTWSSVVRAKAVFGARRVLVVTQGFHLGRAVWLARRAGLSADGVDADLHGYGRLGQKAELRETAARVKSVLEVVAGRRPRYLGPPFDLAGDGRLTKG
jgi:SanA protein